VTTTTGTAPARADELERRFGDPYDQDNPLGFGAILAADERDEMFSAGERVLDDYGLNAEFVPPAYGGRLARVDDLVEVMRSVYRRDPCLGLGYGASSFIASVNLWTSASAEQRRTAADMLLANRKIACAYHELAHGNDMARTGFEAIPGPDGLVLNGRKEVVTNLKRSDAVVMFARTGHEPGTRSHSQIFVDKSALRAEHVRDLPRSLSSGMRGVQLGGLEFTDCPLPADSLLGGQGRGLETALKSFQLTRTALPAMMTALLDTGLRTAIGHVSARRLYHRTVIDLPYIRSVLVGAFADLLMCEAFALFGARAIHLLPGQTSGYAAAVKFGISKPLLTAMHQLSVVLGAHSYLREGPNAIFQKMHRDLQPVGFGHAARAACQMSLLPQLPLLARRSWASPATADANLFRMDAVLPEIPFDRLAVSAAGRDHLASSLVALRDEDIGDERVRESVAHFTAELDDLAEAAAALKPGDLTFEAEFAAYDLVPRYVAVLMATACVQLWRHNDSDPFLGDPAWLVAVLHRLRARPDGPAELPDDVEARLLAELTDRHAANRSFGITNRSFPS
jgi:alkylation response protein AidB-like acyl-CoA dehydrogenase